MSRVVNPDNAGKQRDRLMKAVTLTLRELAQYGQWNAETRDMTAFMALALNQIHDTIDVTCVAWEKRDYWLKADQFRREWSWAGRLGAKLEQMLFTDDVAQLPPLMAELSKRLEKVNLPKRNTLGTPWPGAFEQLKKERGIEELA